MKRTYDSTVAIMAATIYASWTVGIPGDDYPEEWQGWAVAKARAIAAEVERTEPREEGGS